MHLLSNIIIRRTKKLYELRNCTMFNDNSSLLRGSSSYICQCPRSLKLQEITGLKKSIGQIILSFQSHKVISTKNEIYLQLWHIVPWKKFHKTRDDTSLNSFFNWKSIRYKSWNMDEIYDLYAKFIPNSLYRTNWYQLLEFSSCFQLYGGIFRPYSLHQGLQVFQLPWTWKSDLNTRKCIKNSTSNIK